MLIQRKKLAVQGSSAEVTTPVWKGGVENSYSANGQTSNMTLADATVENGILSSKLLKIISPLPFESGHEPTPSNRPRPRVVPPPTRPVPGQPNPEEFVYSEYHMSFGVASGYTGIQSFTSFWDEMHGAASWEKLLKGAGQISQQKLFAQASNILNAWFSRKDKNTYFGTSDGRWDLVTDKGVVRHENGHFVIDMQAPALASFYGASMHEGLADAIATLFERDPELGEDQGKIDSGAAEGRGKRNSYNQLTRTEVIFNAQQRMSQDQQIQGLQVDPHEMGKVFSGFYWAIGEYFHKLFTGRERNPALDVEKLDKLAAKEALKIATSTALFLGTRWMTPMDFVRAALQAIDSLAAAGKFDSRINVAELKQFALAEAEKRELNSALESEMLTENAKPLELTAREDEAAALEALSKTPLSRFINSLELSPIGAPIDGPNGEQIKRFVVRRVLQVDGRPVSARLEDDYLTLIVAKDGTYTAQLGVLSQAPIRPQMIVPRGVFGFSEENSANTAVSIMTEQPFVNTGANQPTQPFVNLKAWAREDLRKLSKPAPESSANFMDEKAENPLVKLLGSVAESKMNKGEFSRELVFRNGVLQAKLMVGDFIYYAPVQENGAIGTPERQLDIIAEY